MIQIVLRLQGHEAREGMLEAYNTSCSGGTAMLNSSASVVKTSKWPFLLLAGSGPAYFFYAHVILELSYFPGHDVAVLHP